MANPKGRDQADQRKQEPEQDQRHIRAHQSEQRDHHAGQHAGKRRPGKAADRDGGELARALARERREDQVEQRLQRQARLQPAHILFGDLFRRARQAHEAFARNGPAILGCCGHRGGMRADRRSADAGKTKSFGELGDGQRIDHAAGNSALHDDVTNGGVLRKILVGIGIFPLLARPRPGAAARCALCPQHCPATRPSLRVAGEIQPQSNSRQNHPNG